jgi:hypothetical protein
MPRQRISGKEAARVAEDMAKPGPIRVVEAVAASEAQEAPGALVPSPGSEPERKAAHDGRLHCCRFRPETSGHVWLHGTCWPGWHQLRRAEAIAATGCVLSPKERNRLTRLPARD